MSVAIDFIRTARRATALLVCLAPAACTPVREPALESRTVPEHTIEEFLGTTAYQGASFSPDGTAILVSSDRSGVLNVWAVPVAGGEPLPLTQSETESVLAKSYFPADERLLYLSDQGGNELTHLYVRERNGEVRDLTPGENLKADFLGWAQDDRTFFLSTNERDPRFFDLYEMTADGYERTLLFQNDGGYELGPVSPDRRHVALEKTYTDTDTDVFLYDRRAGQARNLTAHKGEVHNTPQAFSPDGRWLYYLSDEASEFRYLVRLDLESLRREVVEKPDWDVEEAGFSRQGKYLWIEINNDGRTELRLYETATMSPVRLPGLPEAAIHSLTFSRDETRAAFYVNGSRQPNDLYVLELTSGRARPLTRSLNPKIDPGHLVDGRVERFRSFDNVEIPGIIYKPHAASLDARKPALVWVHGGPGGQSRLTYSALIQYLVNHGYVIYAINNRGSTGYGRTFYKMDDRRHGDADLGDCVASKKFLTATGYVDPRRIGIIGGSYGGYMVLAALAFRPEEFTVGVDIFGVSNWVRTLSSIPPYWESFRKALYQELGDPAADEGYLRRISPLFHAAQIRRPLFVLQGANDPRVLKVESDEIVEAVRANGVPVEYLVFDDEGHGLRKKENQNRGYRAILAFLDARLGSPTAGQPPQSTEPPPSPTESPTVPVEPTPTEPSPKPAEPATTPSSN
jgi:dipeptidyl aminopeptidase/acylaminoacyl peptidase